MNSHDDAAGNAALATHLNDARSKVEASRFADALAILKEAKVSNPKNIYVLAFEKQVEQLIEFDGMDILSEEQRTDILESLPGIIERALEGSSPDAPPPARAAGKSKEHLDREREEKSAALEWLKNQYFQHAHEYVRKGEYTHALAEIRRVYIIDPANPIAKDFERQIDQLISLRKVQTLPQTSGRQPFSPSARTGTERQGRILPGPAPGGRSQTSAPKPGQQAAPSRHAATVTDHLEGRSRLSTPVIVAIIIAVIVLLLAGYYFLFAKAAPPITRSVTSDSPVEEVSFAPLQMDEQKYFVSLTEKDGNFSTQVTADEHADSPGGETTYDDFRPATEKAGSTPSAKPRTPSATPEKTSTAKKATRIRTGGSPGEGAPSRSSGSASLALQESGTPSVGAIVEEARIVRLEDPKFLDRSFAAGLDGQVVVQVEIDREGRPRQTRILRSTNDLLDRAVIEAVNSSEFTPRRTSEGPVRSWMTIPFTFRQNNK